MNNKSASQKSATTSELTDTVRRTERWTLLATIFGSSMAFIDGTVVNVALPVLQHDLRATVTDVQWVVEAYSLFLSALILVGGSLGDLFGRKRIYLTGVTLFTLASIACGFSPNIVFLIAARSVQGIGGALLVPGSLAIITATIGSERRGRAIGTWSGLTSVTTAFGPVLGGWLTDNVGWRWVFFINIPLAIAVIFISLRFVPESRNQEASKNLDWAGAVLVTVGLGGVVYGLTQAGSSSLVAVPVLVSLVIGIVGLVGFVVVETRNPHPMMPLHLFSSRTFSGTNLLTLLLYGALGAVFFFLPFNLIQVQGYSPTEAGFVLLPFVILQFTLSRWAGGLILRYGAKLPLIVGPIIAGIGFLLFGLPGIGGSYWLTFFPAILVMGFGMTIVIAPLTTAVMSAVASNNSGVASGINNAVSRVAGLLAIAVFGIVVVSSFTSSLDTSMSQQKISTPTQQAINNQTSRLTQIELPQNLPQNERTQVKNAVNQAFVDSFRLVMYICAAMAFLSALAAAWLVEGKPAAAKAEAKT